MECWRNSHCSYEATFQAVAMQCSRGRSGLNGNGTHDLRVTGATFLPLTNEYFPRLLWQHNSCSAGHPAHLRSGENWESTREEGGEESGLEAFHFVSENTTHTVKNWSKTALKCLARVLTIKNNQNDQRHTDRQDTKTRAPAQWNAPFDIASCEHSWATPISLNWSSCGLGGGS